MTQNTETQLPACCRESDEGVCPQHQQMASMRGRRGHLRGAAAVTAGVRRLRTAAIADRPPPKRDVDDT